MLPNLPFFHYSPKSVIHFTPDYLSDTWQFLFSKNLIDCCLHVYTSFVYITLYPLQIKESYEQYLIYLAEFLTSINISQCGTLCLLILVSDWDKIGEDTVKMHEISVAILEP